MREVKKRTTRLTLHAGVVVAVAVADAVRLRTRRLMILLPFR